MKLAEIIEKNSIVPELKANDKAGVLEELAQVISDHVPSIEKEALVKVLVERERLGTTGIGDGVAIPHGKLKGIGRPIISFGRSKVGIDFESIDSLPVYLFFLLVATDNSSGIHLQVLAKIPRILKSNTFRKKLMETTTREELYQTIVQADEEH